MNKKTWAIVIILVVSIAAAMVSVLLTKNETRPMDTPGTESTRQPIPAQPTSPSVATKGVYSSYSPEAIGQATGTILLFFYAPWCPQCREIEKTIVESGVPDNVTVLKVDYDSNQALRQTYGVTIQTTFVKVDAQGTKIASYTAYDEPSFSAVQRELLP